MAEPQKHEVRRISPCVDAPLLRLNMAEPSPLWKSEPSPKKEFEDSMEPAGPAERQFDGSPWNHDKDDEKIIVQVSFHPTKRKYETKGDEGQERHGNMD